MITEIGFKLSEVVYRPLAIASEVNVTSILDEHIHNLGHPFTLPVEKERIIRYLAV